MLMISLSELFEILDDVMVTVDVHITGSNGSVLGCGKSSIPLKEDEELMQKIYQAAVDTEAIRESCLNGDVYCE